MLAIRRVRAERSEIRDSEGFRDSRGTPSSRASSTYSRAVGVDEGIDAATRSRARYGRRRRLRT